MASIWKDITKTFLDLAGVVMFPLALFKPRLYKYSNRFLFFMGLFFLKDTVTLPILLLYMHENVGLQKAATECQEEPVLLVLFDLVTPSQEYLCGWKHNPICILFSQIF